MTKKKILKKSRTVYKSKGNENVSEAEKKREGRRMENQERESRW